MRKILNGMNAEPYISILAMDGDRVKGTITRDAETSTNMVDFLTNSNDAARLPLSNFTDVKDLREPNWSRLGIQKEICSGTAQVYTNTNGTSVTKVAEFTQIAKEDFPDLKDEDIRVVFFTGIRRKGLLGVRFQVPHGAEIPGDYHELGLMTQMD